MRRLEFLVTIIFLALFLVGCPPPDSYVKTTELGLENSVNLDVNVEILGLNYFTFISKDTQQLVEAGEMDEEARVEILDQVREQMTNLRQQSLINKKFCSLTYDQAHDGELTIEDVLAAIKTVNKLTPEIAEFIEKLSGGGD